MLEILLLCLYIGVPIIILWLGARYPWVDKIGAVTLCYIVGILFGNLTGVAIPEAFAQTAMAPAVLLSIPLLLFSADFSVWRKMGVRLSLSFLLCVVSVTISVILATLLFKAVIPDAWILASMLMGVYTGGAPNLAAIGLSLGVSHEHFLIISAVEMLFGGIWLLVLLTVAKPLLGKVLTSTKEVAPEISYHLDEQLYWRTSPVAFAIALVMVAIAGGIAFLFFDPDNAAQQPFFMTTAFLLVTTLGIAGSLIPFVRKLKGSFGLGNYLLLVFCTAVGSLAHVQMLFGASLAILVLVGFVMVLTIILHFLLSKLFRIDVDTFMISSTAAIFGPPFIAPVAKAIRDPYIIPVGLALGVLGLAIGNYCGFGISHLLRMF